MVDTFISLGEFNITVIIIILAFTLEYAFLTITMLYILQPSSQNRSIKSYLKAIAYIIIAYLASFTTIYFILRDLRDPTLLDYFNMIIIVTGSSMIAEGLSSIIRKELGW